MERFVTRDVSTMTDLVLGNDNLKVKSNVKDRPVSGYLEPFRITWKGLTYKVKDNRIILNNISGSFRSGEITAIMGPSGSGKSTFLSCLYGLRKKGLTGSVTISTKRKVKFAFISQDNYFLKQINVREALIYASKLKNKVFCDHKMIVENVIHKLLLDKCADNRPNRCSGGQLKRVSIALELVSRPNVLILDEPTSGLDTVTTKQLINTLIELTQQPEPVAVVVTIHQPSAKLFNLFNSIYLLSYEGQCVYNGSPLNIVKVFNDYGLNCPQYTNPADFALEVASKEHGLGKVMMLSTVMKIKALDLEENEHKIDFKQKYNTGRHIWILTIRSIQTTIRDPILLTVKIFGYLIISVIISVMYGPDSGAISGCTYDINIAGSADLVQQFKDFFGEVFENCAGLGFMCMFGWFMSIFPILLVFPQEVNVFLKEYGNGYYSCFSYLMSKSLSDIPFQLILPNLGSIPVYYLTGQYSAEVWRIYGFALIFILISMNASAQGFLLSVIFPENPPACAFIGLLSIVPMLLLSGIMIQIEAMPIYFRYFAYINYIKYGLVSALIDVYGFGRCSATVNNNTIDFMSLIPPEKLIEIYSSDKINAESLLSSVGALMNGITDENYSLVLNYFNISELGIYLSIPALVLNIFVYRCLTYLFILKKVNSKS